MPLQNRVTPRGEIVATPARGTLMGNRGCLHDRARHLVRNQVGGYRAWITCLLDFKGRRRTPMTPGRYTELFFLDEATALAAGHRPCGECRRPDYRRFKTAWLAGNAARGLGEQAPIAEIDRILHGDRLLPGGRQRTFSHALAALPDGAFVLPAGATVPYLLWRGGMWPWTPGGYGPETAPPEGGRVTVLTPRSTVAALQAGYAPAVHESALAGRGARQLELRGPAPAGDA
jgi:hypothetical protein